MGADRSGLVAEGYEAALKLQRLLGMYPLAFRSLWHRPSPRTSQRRAVQALMGRAVKVGLLVGGNRSGKTESGAMIAAAVALGRGDPAVAKWMKELYTQEAGPSLLRQLDLERIHQSTAPEDRAILTGWNVLEESTRGRGGAGAAAQRWRDTV